MFVTTTVTDIGAFAFAVAWILHAAAWANEHVFGFGLFDVIKFVAAQWLGPQLEALLLPAQTMIVARGKRVGNFVKDGISDLAFGIEFGEMLGQGDGALAVVAAPKTTFGIVKAEEPVV